MDFHPIGPGQQMAQRPLPVLLRRWRRYATLCFALCLVAFAFESALHSVHHLFEPAKEAGCQTHTTSKHLTGTPVDHSNVSTPDGATEAAPPVRVKALQRFGSSPVKERAPPLLSA